ncbi:MAG: hypothetical protein GDA40_01725 [Rhodobacteraceae bacterium]|nr:hypothetical protein [Paracoccaceae bacterium]
MTLLYNRVALVGLGLVGSSLFHAMARHGLVRFADPAEAAACDAALQRHGVILRRVEEYGLPNCLRITVGDEAACRLVARTIGDFIAKTREGAEGRQG